VLDHFLGEITDPFGVDKKKTRLSGHGMTVKRRDLAYRVKDIVKALALCHNVNHP
jgi:hypothetical protein